MDNNRTYRPNENNLIVSKIVQIVHYILGAFETIFALRLIFKFLGANPESTFVSLIYTFSGTFIAPFSGIFRTAVTKGIETESVLEPNTIIAMFVYALIGYGVVRLIEIYGTSKDTRIG